ncbi:nuclear transport factor 2 family protein [Lentzea sp. NPDC006480]|uniref:nuclear transport factor 2 family protein n=1 Tax=Lentzea sp. NPDC006480 TaxID=3157176 RepID=UPI0033A05E3A
MNPVLELFRRAVTDNDADAMREGVELMFGDLDAQSEYELRSPDYVMEMPQSGERISGRDDMRAMQEAFPKPPAIELRRVSGAGKLWVVEGVNDYGDGDDAWHVVVVWELDDDGRIVRDTRYYSQKFAPPQWRAQWVELT